VGNLLQLPSVSTETKNLGHRIAYLTNIILTIPFAIDSWTVRKVATVATIIRGDRHMNYRVSNEKRDDNSNRKAFDTYGSFQYDVRVQAFSPDDSRWLREHMLQFTWSH